MFGMGTGAPPSHRHRIQLVQTFPVSRKDSSCAVLGYIPASLKTIQEKKSGISRNVKCFALCVMDSRLALTRQDSLKSQALGVLVQVRSTPCGAPTPCLSTLCSTRRLTILRYGKPHLKAGFTLRCFQRLSLPNAATRLHGWRHDRYTVGSSTPVLSYWGQSPSSFLRPRWIWTELSHDVLNPAHVPL